MREGGKPLPLAFQYWFLWYKDLGNHIFTGLKMPIGNLQ